MILLDYKTIEYLMHPENESHILELLFFRKYKKLISIELWFLIYYSKYIPIECADVGFYYLLRKQYIIYIFLI